MGRAPDHFYADSKAIAGVSGARHLGGGVNVASDAAIEVERRRSERRCGDDRRESPRFECLPRRARLRRQQDLVSHMRSGDLDGREQSFSSLDSTMLRFELV
jgi:hypothetical protein